MSSESAGPVSAPTHSLPVESHPSSGGRGVSGPAGPPQVGVSALGYPSGLAGPPESNVRSGEQVSSKSSLATVVADESTSSSSPLAAAPYQQQLASRQPPAAATETAAAQGLTLL